MSLSFSVLSQSGSPKSVGSGSGRIPHFMWSIYRGGDFFFLSFLKPGVKLDEESIENGLEGLVSNVWLSCVLFGVVATTQIQIKYNYRIMGHLEITKIYRQFSH